MKRGPMNQIDVGKPFSIEHSSCLPEKSGLARVKDSLSSSLHLSLTEPYPVRISTVHHFVAA